MPRGRTHGALDLFATNPNELAAFFLGPQISVYEFAAVAFAASVTVLESFLGGRLSVVMATINGHASSPGRSETCLRIELITGTDKASVVFPLGVEVSLESL